MPSRPALLLLKTYITAAIVERKILLSGHWLGIRTGAAGDPAQQIYGQQVQRIPLIFLISFSFPFFPVDSFHYLIPSSLIPVAFCVQHSQSLLIVQESFKVIAKCRVRLLLRILNVRMKRWTYVSSLCFQLEICVTKLNQINKPSLEGGQGPSRAVVPRSKGEEEYIKQMIPRRSVTAAKMRFLRTTVDI